MTAKTKHTSIWATFAEWRTGRAKIIILILSITLLAGYAVWYFSKDEVIEQATITRHDLVQEVSISGAVKPATELDLAFETGGKIAKISVGVGESVRKGQVLASLQNTSLLAQRAQAQSALQSAQAQLNQSQKAAARERVTLEELRRGSSQEEIAVAESKLESAKKTQSDARIQFSSTLYSLFLVSEDAIRNDADTVIEDPRTNPRLIFPTEYEITQVVENGRLEIEKILKTWQQNLTGEIAQEEVSDFEIDARSRLGAVLIFLDNLNYALNVASPSVRASQTVLDTWSTLITASRSTVVAAVSTLSTSYAQVTQAGSAVSLAERELDLVRSGASAQQISVQEFRIEEADIAVNNYAAQVQKSQADIQYINASLEQAIMRAPQNGIVVKQHVQQGEVVSPREVVFELVSQSNNEIEVYVPEADIAKISIGDVAYIEFDAYPNDEPIPAEILFIDPASTETDGLSTYRVLITLNEGHTLTVKPGMTIDATIITDTKEQVVAVPLRATRVEDGQAFIQIVSREGIIEKRPIQLGLRSTSGLVELIEGAEEGEQYIPVF